MPDIGLKRSLGLPSVTFIAVGFTIGAGVFVFTGIVVKITGPALPLAYALAVIPVFLSLLPLAMLGAAVPVVGGNYFYPSRMVSPAVAFVGIWIYILASFFGQIPLYAISCGEYVKSLIPSVHPTTFAILLLTFFFLINLLGIRLAAVVQGLMVVILVAALLFYSTKGIAHFNPERFQGFFQRGAGNLILGVALLTFTYFGSNGIIELGGEIINPGKVIPRALFIAFPIITVVYLLTAIATVGAVDWKSLVQADQPLLTVCNNCMSTAGTGLFTVCGAILALTTTLNALFIVGTKSLLMIINDGLLPASLGTINKRFNTPHLLLLIIWALSVCGVLSGFSLETFASYAALGGIVIFFPVLLSAFGFPEKYAGLYKKSAFRLSRFWLNVCVATGFLMIFFFGIVILSDLGSVLKIGFFLLFGISGSAFFLIRNYQLKKKGILLSEKLKDENWLKEVNE